MTHSPPAVLETALGLAAAGMPVLPLRAGKVPFGNCPSCRPAGRSGPPRCGGRPCMRAGGSCACPAPCHAWAAATTAPEVLRSGAWAPAWRSAHGVGWHPGGAGMTVVDLDSTGAVTWARATLPPTRTVPTTRGQHWLYRGTMPTANRVRPGVDIKSAMSYARWRGPGTGAMTDLPPAVRALPAKQQEPCSVIPAARWDRTSAAGCRHTERYIRTGLETGLAKVRACRESGAGSQAFGVARFLAARHTGCPGPCGLDTIGWEIVAAAVAVGVPEAYATRAVTRGFAAAGAEVP